MFFVLAFGARQVFDSIFAENDEYKPPNVFGFGGGIANPEEQAEKLRQRLQAAAQAGDLGEARRLEKELIQLLSDTGVRYMVDDGDTTKQEQMPDKW